MYAAWDDVRGENGDLVCAFMQSDTSCEMLSRPTEGQEGKGWIWRLHGVRNGMRTARTEFTEFMAGVLTEFMGFTRKLERCLFAHESNETRVVSHVDGPHACAKRAALGGFWIHIAKVVVNKKK